MAQCGMAHTPQFTEKTHRKRSYDFTTGLDIFTLWPLWNCYKHYVTSYLTATHHVKLSKFIASQNYLTFLIFCFVIHYPQLV